MRDPRRQVANGSCPGRASSEDRRLRGSDNSSRDADAAPARWSYEPMALCGRLGMRQTSALVYVLRRPCRPALC
jgi:hypothetical protein